MFCERQLEKHARIGGCCEWARPPNEWKGSKPVEARGVTVENQATAIAAEGLLLRRQR
jgi:hypothetical protein